MRPHFSIALLASFIMVVLADWPEEDLFDGSDSLEDIPSSYSTDDSLQNLFQPEVTTDPPEDDSALSLGCTSSGSDELMRKAKTRRQEGICPSAISPGGMGGFNTEQSVRYRIQATQDRAQREGRVLEFCPPPTQPLCCLGLPDYLGMQVSHCQPCMSTLRANQFSFFLPHQYHADDGTLLSAIVNPLEWACSDIIRIFCCTSYEVSFAWRRFIARGKQTFKSSVEMVTDLKGNLLAELHGRHDRHRYRQRIHHPSLVWHLLHPYFWLTDDRVYVKHDHAMSGGARICFRKAKPFPFAYSRICTVQ